MGQATGLHPRKVTFEIPVVARTIAADGTTVIGKAPFTGAISKVSYVPTEAIVGDDADTRTITLVNKGLDGNGATEVASLALVTGTDVADFDEVEFTLAEDPDDLDVVKGSILAWVSTHDAGGDGLVDPGGMAFVEIRRD